MPNVLIRDVPDDVHAELVHRASNAGQSLQLYLKTELERLARTPSLASVLADIEAYNGSNEIGFERAVSLIREVRDAP
ncbi:MAG: FitA-like ribbon-helix-helix domain-containing protein [Acidimicrobiia bacterium]